MTDLLDHFISLLEVEDHDKITLLLSKLSINSSAELFVNLSLCASSMNFLADENWIQNKKVALDENDYQSFMSQFLKAELEPLNFLHEFLKISSAKSNKALGEKAGELQSHLISIIQTKTFSEKKEFLIASLTLMSSLFEWENTSQIEKQTQGRFLSLTLYRAFDALDEILNLHYSADLGMKTNLENTERLYEGAGAGVQSGYSTVLLALSHLNPKSSSRMIDLGSGYGRVGLIVGLVRPDIQFTGYEYVDHRVEISNQSSQNFQMEKHVRFFTQDLSLEGFQIPEADIYYLYDPFSDDTYAHVLSQLVQISQKQKISIITKGNALGKLLEIVKQEKWPNPQLFDNGNLGLFTS